MQEQFEKEEIRFPFPLERPHCGVPLANGNFGALVWGRETLNLTIGQNDLWDHRIGELVDERDSYDRFAAYAKEHGYDSGLNKLFHRDNSFIGRSRRLPIGRFDFHFAEGIVLREAVLHYETGMLDIVTSGNAPIRLISVLKQNILYVFDPCKEIQSVSLHPASDFPKVRQFNAERGMDEYERLADGWKIRPPADPEFTARAEKTAYGWKIYTNQDGDDSCMEQQIAFTNSWWSSYSARTPRITVPDPWWNRFFRFSQYKFGAATCPFGYPSGLQGPWHEEYQDCQWSGDFHFNVNVQMIYGPAFALGVAEHLLPLFDMIESPSFQSAMKHNAKSLFKVDDALWQTHAVDDRGLQCGWLGCGAVLDPACGAWTALLYYDYYRYTNDAAFLRDRAWPYIYGIMRGYECMLDSEFNIPVAISAEYASSNRNMKTVAGRNPSYQLAAIRKLAKILIELSAVLKREERPIWRKILEKVPEFTTVSGYDSYGGKDEQRIAIWENQDLEVCHRHHSHLGCIWPFDSLPENPDPETEQIIANSIDHWISMGFGQWSEWCIPWANIIYTRMGLNEAPMQLFGIWKEIFVNEGFATVYLPRMLSLIAHRRHDIAKPKETNEVMQLDGTCGFLSAFMEMCAYPRFGKVNLFRGMPSKWKDIRVENLTLPGGGVLTAERGGEMVISGGVQNFTLNFDKKNYKSKSIVIGREKRRRKVNKEMLKKKILGAWLGKAVGGTLGQPWEGSRGPLELTFYDPMPTGMMPNDDLDLQVLWVCRLNTDWNAVISRRNFEQAWLENIRFPFDEYGVAIRNLKMGIHAPSSGSYDNWFRDGLGAAIRSEIWACLAPGDPELAAEYAYEDACVDHCGNGIYAEQFLAALESTAFAESDLNRLIEAGLSVIPSDCTLAHAIRDTRRWCEIHPDFLAVRSKIMEYYGSANFTDVKMNLSFEIAALLLGNGDFGKTVCLAANAGQDADCTAATVGAILGIRDPESIPAEWLAPIGTSLLVSKEIVGINPPASLDEFTDLVISLKERISLKKPESIPFEAKQYEIPCKVSYFRPWFAADFRKFRPKPAETEETVLLPGNLVELDFTNQPVESLRIMRTEFRLEKKQLIKVMVNTPANVQVWVDGKFCFGRECGAMVPAFHRALQNQICPLELDAGTHTLIIGVAPTDEQMKKTEMLFGVSDSGNFWLDNVFRMDN